MPHCDRGGERPVRITPNRGKLDDVADVAVELRRNELFSENPGNCWDGGGQHDDGSLDCL